MVDDDLIIPADVYGSIMLDDWKDWSCPVGKLHWLDDAHVLKFPVDLPFEGIGNCTWLTEMWFG